MTTEEILDRAVALRPYLSLLTEEVKNRGLHAMADALVQAKDIILTANEEDVAAARDTLSEVMIDRLMLNEARVQGMADGIRAVAALPDPVGRVLSEETRADGLRIHKIAVPMGVVAIIYESRPNVTSDAAALAFKSGNICVLRAGKEAHRTAATITAALSGAVSPSATV